MIIISLDVAFHFDKIWVVIRIGYKMIGTMDMIISVSSWLRVAHLQLVQSRHRSRLRSPCRGPWESVPHEVFLHRRESEHCRGRALWVDLYILALAVGIHEFLELRRPFDFKEDLSAILRFHLYVDVLCVSRVGRTSSCRRGSLSVCSSWHLWV